MKKNYDILGVPLWTPIEDCKKVYSDIVKTIELEEKTKYSSGMLWLGSSIERTEPFLKAIEAITRQENINPLQVGNELSRAFIETSGKNSNLEENKTVEFMKSLIYQYLETGEAKGFSEAHKDTIEAFTKEELISSMLTEVLTYTMLIDDNSIHTTPKHIAISRRNNFLFLTDGQVNLEILIDAYSNIQTERILFKGNDNRVVLNNELYQRILTVSKKSCTKNV